MKRRDSLVVTVVVAAGCAAVAQRRAPAVPAGPVVSFDEQGVPTVTLQDAPERVSLRASWAGEERTFAFERTSAGARARLEGAPRSTDVRYELGIDGRWSGPFTLRTLPGDETPRWSFAVLGDSGRSFGEQGPGPDQLAVAKLLDDLAPDLALHAGDVIYDDDKPWATAPYFSGPYAKTLARVPFLVAIGNHDLEDGSAGERDAPSVRRAAAQPPRATPGAWASFDVGAVHFVLLDSNAIPAGDEATFRATKQGRWLDADLAAATARFKVVVLHHPLYSAKKSRAQGAGLRLALEPSLVRGRVGLLIAGHDHHYHRTRPIQGVVHVTTGGGGAALYDGDSGEGSAAFARAHHLVRVIVERAALTVEAVAPATSGSAPAILDRFVLPAR